MASCCIKGLEGSNYDVRVCIAELLGSLLASSQKPEAAKTKRVSLEEVFNIMSAAFLRGGVGFLKGGSGELLKSGSSQDVRVGVTQVIVIRVFSDIIEQPFAYSFTCVHKKKATWRLEPCHCCEDALFLVSYVVERPWWPMQSSNKGRKKKAKG